MVINREILADSEKEVLWKTPIVGTRSPQISSDSENRFWRKEFFRSKVWNSTFEIRTSKANTIFVLRRTTVFRLWNRLINRPSRIRGSGFAAIVGRNLVLNDFRPNLWRPSAICAHKKCLQLKTFFIIIGAIKKLNSRVTSHRFAALQSSADEFPLGS